MPSAVAVYTGLTYGAADLQDFPRVFLQIVEGGPDTSPEIRGSDRTMPYRRGRIYGPKRADRLPIQLKGWVSGEGATEAEQRSDTALARQELFALFNAEGGPQVLSVTTEDGTVWTCSAYPEVFLPEMEPMIPTHVGISVRLICIDPPNWVAGIGALAVTGSGLARNATAVAS